MSDKNTFFIEKQSKKVFFFFFSGRPSTFLLIEVDMMLREGREWKKLYF